MHSFFRAMGALPLLFVTITAAADAPPLDEVVVTANLRDRELRDLPASATVLDARTLAAAGVQHFQDVLGLVPNLNWSAGTSRPRYFQLRGIGDLSQWQGAPNPSVGFLIDGIDFSGVGMPATLSDVERIEVLRGPQGTAYGANALAGLIAINTRAPRRDPELNADLTLGDYGTRGATGVLGGPIGGGEAAWRLVAGNHRSDGFRHNSFLRRDDTNGYDESSARLRLSAEPFEHLRADVTAMWADLQNGYDAFSIDNSRTTLSDKPGQDAQIARALGIRLDYGAFAAFDVVGRFSFGKSRSIYSYDGDWGNDVSWGANSPYDYFQRYDRDRQTRSSDLRIVSRESVANGGAFAWLAGVYALRTDEDVRQTDTWRDLVYGDGESRFASDYRATNVAAYGEVEWRVAASTVLAIGARGERRDADYSDTDAARFAPDETMFGGSLSLRRAFGERRTAYVTWARGYKAGGFNIGADVPPGKRSFDGETLESIELGFRASSAADVVGGDVALFYMRRHDQQVPTGEQLVLGDPLTFVLYTDNAAAGENYGVEGTLRWRLSTALQLDVRAALLQAKYRDYVFGGVDLSGREQAHAPEYQYDLGVEYRGATGFFARVDFAGLDDFYFDETNDVRAPSRVLTHLKAGYSGNRWRAEVWVRNLFDEYYSQRGFWFGNEPPDFTPTRYVQAGDPRHAGVTVAYTFR
jgi:iron complex outermembrane recepter protein